MAFVVIHAAKGGELDLGTRKRKSYASARRVGVGSHLDRPGELRASAAGADVQAGAHGPEDAGDKVEDVARHQNDQDGGHHPHDHEEFLCRPPPGCIWEVWDIHEAGRCRVGRLNEPG